MIRVSDNFKYNGPKPNFERDLYLTTSSLKAVTDDKIDDGHLGYCIETEKIYEYLYSNSIDTVTGKWREFKGIDSELDKDSPRAIQSKAVAGTVNDLLTKFDNLSKQISRIKFDDKLDENSTYAVQNKIITAEFNTLGQKITSYTNLAKDFLRKDEVLGEINASSELPIQNKVLTGEFNSILKTIENLSKKVWEILPIDKTLNKTSTHPVANSAITPKVKTLQGKIDDLYEKVRGLKYYSAQTYYVSGWSKTDKLTPTSLPNESYGNPDVLRNWQFYLVDHNQLSKDKTKVRPIAKLQKNNLFRDEDGNFVKTVFTDLRCKCIFDSKTDGIVSIFGDWFKDKLKKIADTAKRYVIGIGAPPEGDDFSSRQRHWMSIWEDDDFFGPKYEIRLNERDELIFIRCTETYPTLSLEEFMEEIVKSTMIYAARIEMKLKWYIAWGDLLGISNGGDVTELFNLPLPWEEYQKPEGTPYESLKSVVLGNPKTLYLLDQLEGKSGKIWKGVFEEPCIWDGIDVSKYELKPTGMGPTPATSVYDNGTVQKMFTRFVDFYKLSSKANDGSDGFRPHGNCMGHKGSGNVSDCFMPIEVEVEGETYNRYLYGRSADVSQLTDCTYSRNNNPDITLPYPFAEGGYHSRNVFVSAMETLYKTKYLNASNFFASGISANDAVTNETQLMTYGGIKWRPKGESEWKYGTWNTTPADICYDGSGNKTHFNALLAYWFPKEQVLESQTAASWAVEFEIEENEHFEMYGGEYWYKNVPGAIPLREGEMNCILYKRIPYTLKAYDTAGNSQNFELEIVLRMSLMNGYNHSGDYWIYYGGGYEQVGTVAPIYSSTDSDTLAATGHPVSIYTCFDQMKWRPWGELQQVTKDELGTFDFESDPNYWKAWEGVNLGDGYCLVRPPYTAYKAQAGGSLSTGECFYAYTSKNWSSTLGQRVRIGLRQRPCLFYDLVCIRFAMVGWYRVDIVGKSGEVGGSLQCLLEV